MQALSATAFAALILFVADQFLNARRYFEVVADALMQVGLLVGMRLKAVVHGCIALMLLGFGRGVVCIQGCGSRRGLTLGEATSDCAAQRFSLGKSANSPQTATSA